MPSRRPVTTPAAGSASPIRSTPAASGRTPRTFPLNRWSEAVTIHNRFGSLARAISFRTSDSGTNSSMVEWIAASGTGVSLPTSRAGAERRFVRHAVRHVDQRILPSPSQLVSIGQSQRDDAATRRCIVGIGRREHRQPGALRHANQDRPHRRATRRELHERDDSRAARHRRGACAPRREALEIRLHIEADDEVAASRRASRPRAAPR